jgi:hypothetical protein
MPAIRFCDSLLPLSHSPSDDMEDVPVLVLAELGFARAILFGEFAGALIAVLVKGDAISELKAKRA